MKDRFFKCLVNENRRKILYCIGKDAKCVDTISRCLDLEQSLVSHHLRELRNCGLVEREKRGKKRYYKVSRKEIIELLEKAIELGDELEKCEV